MAQTYVDWKNGPYETDYNKLGGGITSLPAMAFGTVGNWLTQRGLSDRATQQRGFDAEASMKPQIPQTPAVVPKVDQKPVQGKQGALPTQTPSIKGSTVPDSNFLGNLSSQFVGQTAPNLASVAAQNKTKAPAMPTFPAIAPNNMYTDAVQGQIGAAEGALNKIYDEPLQNAQNYMNAFSSAPAGPLTLRQMSGAISNLNNLSTKKAGEAVGLRTAAYSPMLAATEASNKLPEMVNQARIQEILNQRLAQTNPMVAAELEAKRAEAEAHKGAAKEATARAEALPRQAVMGYLENRMAKNIEIIKNLAPYGQTPDSPYYATVQNAIRDVAALQGNPQQNAQQPKNQ